MNDLNALAAQKASQQQDYQDLPEDSPELKTPTAEDIMVPEQKVSQLNMPHLKEKYWFSIYRNVSGILSNFCLDRHLGKNWIKYRIHFCILKTNTFLSNEAY